MKTASIRRKFVNAVLLGLFFFSSLTAQTYQKTTTGVKTNLQSMDVEVQFFSPTIVRVIKSPEGVAFKKESLSVTKIPQKTDFSVNQQGDVVSMKSDKMEVDLNLLTGRVTYIDLTGNVLFTEKTLEHNSPRLSMGNAIVLPFVRHLCWIKTSQFMDLDNSKTGS